MFLEICRFPGYLSGSECQDWFRALWMPVHSRLVQSLCDYPLASRLAHAAADLVATLQEGLVLHSVGVVEQVRNGGSAQLLLFRIGGPPFLYSAHYRFHLVSLQFFVPFSLPLSA